MILPLRIALVSAGVAIAAMLASAPGCASAKSNSVGEHQSYRRLASLLTSPMSHQTAALADTPEAQTVLMANEERVLGQLAKSPAPVGPLADQCANALSDLTVAYCKFVRSPEPSGLGLLAGLARLGGEEPTPLVHSWEVADDEKGKKQEDAALELGALADRFHATCLGLLQIASKLSGDKSETPSVRSEFFESGKVPGVKTDQIQLTNISGKELHDCLIAVSLTSARGESRTNIHFVEEWKPKQTLAASYSSGVEVAGVRLGRQTLSNVQGINVAVWARELRCDSE